MGEAQRRKRERESLSAVFQQIHPDDLLYQWLLRMRGNHVRAHDEYLSDGRRCAEMFADLVGQYCGATGIRVLEFASGYGRVSRHLAATLPDAAVTCSDIHPAANRFVAHTTGYPTIQSSAVPEDFPIDSKFNVTFALSLFSHLSHRVWTRWLNRLYETLAPGGVLMFSTHGGLSIVPRDTKEIVPGFLYSMGRDQGDLDPAEYGTSFVTQAYVSQELRKIPGAELVNFSEGYWWGHQDLYVVRSSDKLGRTA